MQRFNTYIISFCCLLAGGMVYVFGRSHIIFVQFCHLEKWSHSLNCENQIIYIIVYCLPDALWYFALLLLQFHFWNMKQFISGFLVVISVLLPFLLEFLQYYSIISGTFDVWDVLTYLLTFLIFCSLCLKRFI